MKNKINSLLLILLFSICFSAINAAPTIVTTNQTWTTTTSIPEKLIIEAGVTLTVQGTVLLYPDVSVLVKCGGRLIINGGTFTSYYAYRMWKGIFVAGNTSANQILGSQGELTLLNGATIQNADIAVSTWDGVNATTTAGAIIRASNANFINNRCAVEFKAYKRMVGTTEMDNTSYFTKCNFIVNNNNIIFPNGYQLRSAQVLLYATKGIKFSGCKFHNLTDKTNSVTYRSKAIDSHGAQFTVDQHCSGNYYIPQHGGYASCVGTVTRSEFKGWGFAIDARTLYSGTNTIKVDRTDFENNYYGIYLWQMINPQITRCNFNLTESPVIMQPGYGISAIMTTDITGYKIEENNIYTTHPTIPTNYLVWGMSISNSGTAENVIYKNTFSKLGRAIYITQTNGENSATGSGLRFECNTFENNIDDIRIREGAIVKSFQGSNTKGADNKYLNTNGVNFYSENNSQNITYIYNYQNSQFRPNNISTNVARLMTEATNSCTSSFYSGGLVIDPGPGPGGIGFSKSTNVSDVELYETMNKSYNELKKEFIEKGYSYILENTSNEDSKEYKNAVNCQSQIVSLSSEMALLSNKNISNILMAESLNIEELKKWYDIVNTPAVKYHLVEIYFVEGDYTQAYSTLLNIPNMFDFNTREFEEHQNYIDFYELREHVLTSGRTFDLITDEEVEFLKEIADKETGASSTMAGNMLCTYKNVYCYKDIEYDDKGTFLANESSEKFTNDNISIYPNPTSGKISIDNEEGDISTIVVMDQAGKIIKEFSYINNNQINIDLTDLSTGSYIIKINSGNKVIYKNIVKE